jgi:hypothetical protein
MLLERSLELAPALGERGLEVSEVCTSAAHAAQRLVQYRSQDIRELLLRGRFSGGDLQRVDSLSCASVREGVIHIRPLVLLFSAAGFAKQASHK